MTSDLAGHLLECTETFHHSSETLCYRWRDGRERLGGEGRDKWYRELRTTGRGREAWEG